MGLIKGYKLTDDFINLNGELYNKLLCIFDKLYKDVCCVLGAKEIQKDNTDIKNELLYLLYAAFDAKVIILNAFDSERYKNKKAIRNYILAYEEAK